MVTDGRGPHLESLFDLLQNELTPEKVASRCPHLTWEQACSILRALRRHVSTCPGWLASLRELHVGADPSAWFELYCDGASRGNPGPAGAGSVLLDPKGDPVVKTSTFIGKATNNEAEYQALIRGLQVARDCGIRRIRICLDSELVVKQIQGSYRVRHRRLRPLFDQAMDALRHFDDYDIVHLPRSANATADRLANEAIDRGARGGEREIQLRFQCGE